MRHFIHKVKRENANFFKSYGDDSDASVFGENFYKLYYGAKN